MKYVQKFKTVRWREAGKLHFAYPSQMNGDDNMDTVRYEACKFPRPRKGYFWKTKLMSLKQTEQKHQQPVQRYK
jgi:hypothetical protein